jgi:hypothetical protein
LVCNVQRWRQRSAETEMVVSGDGGESMWRRRRKYVETEAEVCGDGECM